MKFIVKNLRIYVVMVAVMMCVCLCGLNALGESPAKLWDDVLMNVNRAEWNDIVPISASVLSNEVEELDRILSIDKGTANGIEVGMVVVMVDGLVGYVQEAEADSSKVSTILNSDNIISCIVDKTRDTGVVSIGAEGAKDMMGSILYLPHNSQASPGDWVTTSGQDARYPKGIKIGQVIEDPNPHPEDEEKIIAISLSVDFDDIGEVFVF